MPICRPSATEPHRVAALLALGLVLSCASPVAAQDGPAASPENARTKAQAAMERLKRAVARQKTQSQSGPTSLPELPEAERRRAFEGLLKRAPLPAMEARAQAALDKGKDALASEREAMAKRLRQALGLDAPDMEAVAKATAPGGIQGWVPVLFASSSMPIGVLRSYAGQLEKVGGVMAFRGMPGGLTKVGPMAKLSAAILRLDPGCEGPACAMRDVQLIVDPLVFRQHGVSTVPALAMIPGDPAQPYCERDDDSPHATHVVYGDAALSGLLDEYARLGGAKEVESAQARLERR